MTSQAAFGPPFFPAILLLLLVPAGCATERVYDGPRLPAAVRALVHADPAVSAGLPVQLRLRQVDERSIPLAASSVELQPGPHLLLVDCRVTESGTTERFTLDVELEPGGEYRLVAVASTRNCEAVELRKH